jgi:ABC-type nickel/cobalt efflux system permease component RcnA
VFLEAMIRSVATLILLVAWAGTASAHPLPNLRYDRKIDVRLAPAGVTVRYTLELSYWTVVLDGKNLFTREEEVEIGGRQVQYVKKYAEKKAPRIAENLNASLNGTAMSFHIVKAEIEPDKDHARIKFELKAAWAPVGGKENRWTFLDGNFADVVGQVWLMVANDPALDVTDLIEPFDLRGKPPSTFQPGDFERARKAAAVFTVADSALPKTEPQPLPITAVTVEVPDQPPPNLFREFRDRGLNALFDDRFGVGVLLLAALVFGAFHAFTPGHGKTLVAAYLVGEKGTIWHAVVLALSTTAMHTGTVIGIAGVLWYLYEGRKVPPETQGYLQLAGGGLLLAVGGWLLLRRIQGRADHVHLTGRCATHAGFGCRPGSEVAASDVPCGVCGAEGRFYQADEKTNWLRVVLLGIGGGIVPCWDAIMLLLVAISAGRLGFALPMLVAFSLGLGAVLVGLGILVVFAHRAGGRAFGDSTWFKFLPAVSAALLVVMGLFFVKDGWAVLAATQ